MVALRIRSNRHHRGYCTGCQNSCRPLRGVERMGRTIASRYTNLCVSLPCCSSRVLPQDIYEAVAYPSPLRSARTTPTTCACSNTGLLKVHMHALNHGQTLCCAPRNSVDVAGDTVAHSWHDTRKTRRYRVYHLLAHVPFPVRSTNSTWQGIAPPSKQDFQSRHSGSCGDHVTECDLDGDTCRSMLVYMITL